MRVELNTNCAPLQHVGDMGYVEACVLAESQTRSQVDLVGPVPPDVSWQAKDAERFDHSRFTIHWEAQRVCCPAEEVRKTRGTSYDRHGKAGVRVRFPLATCQACPLRAQGTQSAARVLMLRPNEQAYRALQEARQRQQTPEFRKVYARRAGVEGPIAQSVRTCEMRRARYIASKKLRLQALLPATALNVLRACAWLTEPTHACTPTSRTASLVASAQQAAAA